MNRFVIIAILSCVFSVLNAQEEPTQALPKGGMSDRLAKIVTKAKLLRTSDVGIVVYDLTADTLVYAFNEKKAYRPASTLKLLTVITALSKLGCDYQYKTQFRYVGEIDRTSHTLNGDLYIIGGMDPTIYEQKLNAVADSLKARGIETINGNIYADRSMKDTIMYGSGWCWDDNNPMLSPLVYNRKDNMLQAFQEVLQKKGIIIKGEFANKMPQKNKPLTSPDAEGSNSVRSFEFTSLENESGVGTVALYTPIDSILIPMLKNSNNLYAESMFYQTALLKGKPATAQKAIAIEQKFLRMIGKHPLLGRGLGRSRKQSFLHSLLGRGLGRFRIADGSGLSLYNYLSAEIEVKLLRYAFQHKEIYNKIYASLPIAGVDGTLKDRMSHSATKGNVHAKTGTLTGVSSLAGYAKSKNGNIIAFSIINQGVLDKDEAHAFQDRICKALCK